MNHQLKTALGLAWLALIPTAAFAADYSPNVGAAAPKRLLWGDTHIHTSWSGDAGAIGNRLDPEQALRFARGEEVVSSTGQKVRLARALDWVVIADHSEGLGLIQEMIRGNELLDSDDKTKRWSSMVRAGGKQGFEAAMELIDAQSNGTLPKVITDGRLAGDVWRKNTALQDKYYEPGRFTTLIGYEWSSLLKGDNLHRNVIFRDGSDRVNQMTPFTSWDSTNPEELWKWLQSWESKTGGQVLAIPHNGNLSNGRMFALDDLSGKPLDRAYATARMRWEPLYETTQYKGDSETHPSLSPNDEFANFERWDKFNLNGVPKKPEQIRTEYSREALKNGLKLDAQLGANPFKFGLIGATDTHTSLATADEDNFYGKHVAMEPSPARTTIVKKGVESWRHAASGYTAVWASDNSREAVWDALKRKEVYASTGPRMAVRLFAGFDFTAADLQRRDWAEIGYARGVPMGGDLKASTKGKAPVFMIQAAKDALGANLDRVQVVKGWVDANGVTHEKVHDVVWAGLRKPGKNGKLPAVGNTVDIKDASYTNTIGAPALATLWKDPAFDAAQRAFYYLRVIEIPTPRWTAYDAKRFGITLPPEVPMIVQDRAYTSPIWYSPQ
jgi:hypothetical protein